MFPQGELGYSGKCSYMTCSNHSPLQHIIKLQLTLSLGAGKADTGLPGAAAHLPWRLPILRVLLVFTSILSTGADISPSPHRVFLSFCGHHLWKPVGVDLLIDSYQFGAHHVSVSPL
jgi:hypothetical protein